jgi:hypothetical protein
MKTIANSCSYGIFIEVNTEDEECDVDVYGLEHFKSKASKRESFGYFFHPIIATMLTSGARLLLAMAESWLTKHDGYYAFCDTDSMTVSPFHWKKLQQFFQRLNPFGDGEFLKLEKENFDKNGRLRDLWFYGISAKRYVLYVFDQKGEPQPVKWSSHGLGQLVHEQEGEWEKQLWANILRHAYGKISRTELLEKYASEYAVAKLAFTKPSLLRRVRGINKGKQNDRKIKPYNFVLVGSPTIFNRTGKPIIPVTPFVRPYDLAPYQPFTDAKSGRLHNRNTELHWKKLDSFIETYIDHPESKFRNGDKKGKLKRRKLLAGKIKHVGKESDELEESEAVGISENPYVTYCTTDDME